MKQIWFKQSGWIYIPIHPAGLARNGHSVSDDRYEMFVYGTCTAFWWKCVAGKTSYKQ